MELNSQQLEAIDTIAKWWEQGNAQEGECPTFYLAGYAGTGKSTLAKYAAQRLGARRTLYGAFTGKAAAVLGNKVGEEAFTIHRLIYSPVSTEIDELRLQYNELRAKQQTPEIHREIEEIKRKLALLNGQMGFTLRSSSPLQEADLLIIDECSMVNQEMAKDLLSFKTPILVLGDPAQLPPVKNAGAFTNNNPDFFLTQIMRQEAENSIIEAASMVRQGKTLPYGKIGENVEKINRGRLSINEYSSYDQVLCGKNQTRRTINRAMRKAQGITDLLPQPGEKLICLRNNYDLGLLNGLQYVVEEAAQHYDTYEQNFVLKIKTEDGVSLEPMVINSQFFEIYEKPDTPLFFQQNAQDFDFGYAITVHKSQGSQWDKVLVCDDWNSKDYEKWLYTAITRAAKNLLVIQ